MNEPKHCVWNTPAPPVCTAQWDQAAWDRWGELHRPASYAGGIHDAEAWKAHRAVESKRERLELLRGFMSSQNIGWIQDEIRELEAELAER